MGTEFKAGDVVLAIDNGYGAGTRQLAQSTVKTIYKVYKNGNFVLEKSGQQYRDDGRACGEWATGKVVHATHEKRAARNAAIQAVNAQRRINKFVQSLQNVNLAAAVNTLAKLKAAGFEV